MYTEIIKIIEGGILRDQEKVFNYANILADDLERNGDLNLSKKIRSVIAKKRSNLATLDEISTKPVDQESRLDIVDVLYPPSEFEDIVINKFIEEEIDNFIKSFIYRDKLMSMGMDIVNSLLLYGPPGCGKTTLAKYISFKTELPLVTTRLDVLVSSLLGSTSKNIRKAFDYASRHQCILFLDEFDFIAKLRDDKHELGELKRVVNSLIQNIDNFNRDSILIAATNHHNLLDPALWRRFTKIITLDKPTEIEILLLIRNILKNIDNNIIGSNKKEKQIIDAFIGFSHADIKTILTNCIKKNLIKQIEILKNYNVLQEVYFYKNHSLADENDFLKYLINFGITQNEINQNFNFSLRKIRETSKLM